MHEEPTVKPEVQRRLPIKLPPARTLFLELVNNRQCSGRKFVAQFTKANFRRRRRAKG
jgi:hypothetical protein